MSEDRDGLYLAREVVALPDIVGELDKNMSMGFDFLLTPLAHPGFERDALNTPSPPHVSLPFTRSDMLLPAGRWGRQIVGMTSPWINLDSENDHLRRNSERAWTQELLWASHLSLPAVLLPPPSAPATNYAHHVQSALKGSLAGSQVWLRIPLVDPAVASGAVSVLDAGVGLQTAYPGCPMPSLTADVGPQAPESDLNDIEETQDAEEDGAKGGYFGTYAGQSGVTDSSGRLAHDTWEWWNKFRVLCEEHPNLSVALELGLYLPDAPRLAKWVGEPVKVILIPTKVFLKNKGGYPVLPKKLQHFLLAMFKYNPQLVITGNPRHENGIVPYMRYLAHLWVGRPESSKEDEFVRAYLDYLQAPLQPLQDHLESGTYEVFERDPHKYNLYEEATYQALMDRNAKGPVETVLFVVGAGRGPLVRAALRAADKAECHLRVIAVEKNPNAVVTLRNMHVSLGWGERVTLVASDMREWKAPVQADIIVSELLGSFGDNELSPECLDGVQGYLKPGGVSIPTAYTSFLAPITSSKLWNEAKAFNDLEHMETAYVVKMHNVSQLSESKPVFTFVHPNKPEDQAIDNTRYAKLSFTATESAQLHGFAGFFDAKLYKKVHCSINPQNHTPGMFSWFPLYFPIRTPVYVPKGSTIEVHMWRRESAKKVWYEWALVSPDVSPIHNPNGRSYYVGK